MNSTLSKFNEAHHPLEAVLNAVSHDRWSAPSPCEDWTTRDVVDHIIGTQRDFFTDRGLDVGVQPEVETDPAKAWRDHAQQVAGVLQDDSHMATEYEGYFGPTTVGGTFAQFYIWDMLVHRWDIATAAGLDAQLTDAELQRIDEGAGAFGENLYMEGICKTPVETGPTSDEKAKVLAKLGRQA